MALVGPTGVGKTTTIAKLAANFRLRDGIRMVEGILKDVLAKHGFQEIDALGQPFDPFLHEAVAYEETSEFPPETVSEGFQKGFTHRGTVIRAAKVKVAKAPADVAAPPDRRGS